MHTQTYISLAHQIRAAGAGIKHIDLYNAQYMSAYSPKELPFNTPAVFIQIADCEWVEQGPGIQEGDTTITLHVVCTITLDTRNLDLDTDPVHVAKIIEPLKVDDLIHEKIQRFTPDGCCREMWRTATRPDNERDRIVVTKSEYSTRLRQIIANPNTRLAPVTKVGVQPSDTLITSGPYTGPPLN